MMTPIPNGDTGDTGDTVPTLREKLSVRYRSINEEASGDSFHRAAETVSPKSPVSPSDAFDLQEERLAIQREAELAVSQRIPNAVMVSGLIRAATWSR